MIAPPDGTPDRGKNGRNTSTAITLATLETISSLRLRSVGTQFDWDRGFVCLTYTEYKFLGIRLGARQLRAQQPGGADKPQVLPKTMREQS